MEKVRWIIVGIVSATYLILVLMKVDIPRNVFITLGGIILISQAIDEWNRYKETKRRYIYLLLLLYCSLLFL